MSDQPTRWSLQPEDEATLARVRNAIFTLSSLAKTGQDLIAIGEAVDAIEGLPTGNQIEVDVGVDVGITRGDDSHEGGFFVCFQISIDGIELGTLTTTYSSSVGSDHTSTKSAILGPNGEFNPWAVDEWLEQLKEYSSCEDADLSVSRNHV